MKLSTHRNCALFVIDRDDDGANIDHSIDIPVTITALDEDGLTPVYQASLSLEDIDRLIEKLSALKASVRV
jgi:hypothetical protein